MARYSQNADLSLKLRSVGAMLWSGADILLRQGVQFVVSIALARLLAPEQFGLVAMLAVFISLSGILIDSGFSYSLVQRQDVTGADVSSVFWFNLLMALSAVAGLWIAGSRIAGYFAEPVLAPLAKLLSLGLLVNTLGSVPRAMLTKRLDFRPLLIAGAAASVISGVVGVALASAGFGVWSLAWQATSSSLVTTTVLWWYYPLTNLFTFRLSNLRRLSSFGGYMLISSLLNAGHSGLVNVLIAKLFSTRELGYYLRGLGTQSLPTTFLSSVFERLALPMFSHVALDRHRLMRGVRQVLVGMMALNAPIMVGLGILSKQVTLVLFGSKWLPCVPYMQILCIGGLFWPLHVVNLNALLALGRSDLFFRLEVVKRVLGLVALVIGSVYGLMAVVWGQTAVAVVCFFINAHYSEQLLTYGIVRQVRDIGPVWGLAVVMGLVVWIIGRSTDFSALSDLMFLVPLGGSMYLGMCHWLGVGHLAEAFTLIRQSFRAATATPSRVS